MCLYLSSRNYKWIKYHIEQKSVMNATCPEKMCHYILVSAHLLRVKMNNTLPRSVKEVTKLYQFFHLCQTLERGPLANGSINGLPGSLDCCVWALLNNQMRFIRVHQKGHASTTPQTHLSHTSTTSTIFPEALFIAGIVVINIDGLLSLYPAIPVPFLLSLPI